MFVLFRVRLMKWNSRPPVLIEASGVFGLWFVYKNGLHTGTFITGAQRFTTLLFSSLDKHLCRNSCWTSLSSVSRDCVLLSSQTSYRLWRSLVDMVSMRCCVHKKSWFCFCRAVSIFCLGSDGTVYMDRFDFFPKKIEPTFCLSHSFPPQPNRFVVCKWVINSAYAIGSSLLRHCPFLLPPDLF